MPDVFAEVLAGAVVELRGNQRHGPCCALLSPALWSSWGSLWVELQVLLMSGTLVVPDGSVIVCQCMVYGRDLVRVHHPPQLIDWQLSIPAHYQKPQLPWCHSVRPWIDTHKWRKWLNWLTHLTRMTFQPLSHRDSRVDSFNSFNSNSTGWTWLIILKSKQVKCQDCQSPTLPSLSFIEAGVAPVIV